MGRGWKRGWASRMADTGGPNIGNARRMEDAAMPPSNAPHFTFKKREELDAMIEDFEHDVAYKLAELQSHYGAYADTILSMTSAEDDKYVYERISRILASRGLLPDESHSGH
jgi:hypothetical protein